MFLISGVQRINIFQSIKVTLNETLTCKRISGARIIQEPFGHLLKKCSSAYRLVIIHMIFLGMYVINVVVVNSVLHTFNGHTQILTYVRSDLLIIFSYYILGDWERLFKQ